MLSKTIKFIFFLFCSIIFINVQGQTTIAFQGFEGTPSDNWTFESPTQATGTEPVLVGVDNYGVGYAHTGNNSCRAGGGSTDCGNGSANCLNSTSSGGGCTDLLNGGIITFDTIDISCYTNVQIEVWHRSNTICVGAGFDASDNLKFEVSINGGAWTEVGLLTGATNHIWDYTDVSAGVSSTVANPFIYIAPVGSYTIAFRTNAQVNRTDEVYYIDDVKITGTPGTLPMPTVNVIQPVCSSPNASIEVVSPNFNGFTYSIDSINFNDTSGIFNALTPGATYFVQVQSPAGCISPVLTVEIDTVISSNLNASITALGPTIFCSGDSVVLSTGVGNIFYQWLLNGNNILGANTVTFTATNPGNYQVVISDTTNCSDTSSAIVVANGIINPPLISTNSGNFSYCNGDSLLLFVPDLYSTYQWLFNGALIANASDSSYVTSTTGNFQVLVTDTSGCADSSNVISISFIAPNPPSIASSTGSFTICPNQQLSLSVPQIYDTYQWFMDGAALPSANSNSITTSDAGFYYVITHSLNACYDTSATIEVIINQPPNPTITPSVSTICLSQTFTLQTSNFNTVQWYLNNTLITNANASNYTANQAGNYTVLVEDANGCTAISNAAQISIDSVAIFINANAQSYCDGDIAILTASGTNFSNLLWSNNSTGTNIQTGAPGNYTVIASSAAGCKDTAAYNLTFSNQLVINASASDSIFNCNETIQLNVSGADKYLWEPSTGLNDASINNPLISDLNNDIIYIVTGTKGNCTAVDSIKINFENCEDIFIPNAFSPNGDGANDEFIVLGNNIVDFNLKIYNRWGQLLFETSQIEVGWDGKYNGKDVNSGVYVWVLNAKDKNGQLIDFNDKYAGNLSLFR